MTVEKKLIPVNFTRGGNQRLGICIHTQVGYLDSTDTWFRNPTTELSAHYGIDTDGSRVFQWVEESDQAYAQGIVSVPTFKMVLDRPGINPNTYLISIECADDKNPAGVDRSKQLPVLVELVKDICKRNSIPIDRDRICGHHEIRSTKTCPGNINVDEVIRLAGISEVTMTDDQKRALDFITTNKGDSNFEGAVRKWYGDSQDKPTLESKSKQLDGLIAKWTEVWRLETGSGIVELEAEMSKLLLLEDRLQVFRDSIEGCVGAFPSDTPLLEAHAAVRKQIDDLYNQVNVLQKKLDEAKTPVGYEFVGSWDFFNHRYKHFKRKAVK